MVTCFDLSELDWKLSGWIPYIWQIQTIPELANSPSAEIAGVSAKVPGSVQYSLREAGLLPDWNVGSNSHDCEWVENRHWIYETVLPREWVETGKTYRLTCLGLDYSGIVRLNSQTVGEFKGTHVPHTFDLTPHLSEESNVLQIIFYLPPRWLGMSGRSSGFTEWKPRFNYTWDWTVRIVQIGIWDSIYIEASDGAEIRDLRCVTDANLSDSTGMLHVRGDVSGNACKKVRVVLSRDGNVVREGVVDAAEFAGSGVRWDGLPVDLWWCNLEGEQPLYDLCCVLCNEDGTELHQLGRRVGFRHVNWRKCEGAPENADPWICEINGRPVFLQGVNFAPVLPNFADAPESKYRSLLMLCKDLGMNVLRINACGFLEKKVFYDTCDELGLMVWQEFPLTSSVMENIPPSGQDAIEEMSEIARSFIVRRQHHASLLMWSGGNELMDLEYKPFGTEHPMLERLQKVAQEEDPGRRFVPASPSGPRCGADADDFGKGLHWDVHGPWTLWADMEAWKGYWANDDALFRSEIGCPSASPAEIIRRYLGDYQELPADATNPIWRRPTDWWITSEAKAFVGEFGREPADIEEFVRWSQARQSEALTTAVRACKERFPRCGGVIIWMGHDCFPCASNTSIIDFDGQPKPVARALRDVWRSVSQCDS